MSTRSIKHYFLMDKGDFFVHFMDLTEEELKKPVDDIVPPRLEALLELALRMSTANTDPFKDDLKVGESRITAFLMVVSTWFSFSQVMQKQPEIGTFNKVNH